MSRRFRILLYVLGTLAIMAGVLFGIISTAWFQRTLARQVIASLEERTGCPVEIHEFRFRATILQLAARGVVLHGKHLPAEPPLFSARSVTLQINPISLIRRRVVLKSFQWDGAEVHLITRPDGSTNLPQPRVPSKPGGVLQHLVDWSVERLTLSRTQISWNEQRASVEVCAENVSLLLQSHLTGSYSGSISSSATLVKTSRGSLPPVSFNARFEFSGSGVDVTSLAWRCAGLEGRGSFDLRHPSSPEGRFAFQAGGEVGELARAWEIHEIVSGRADLMGEGTYGPGGFEAKGKIQARRLVVRPSTTPQGMDLATDYSTDGRRVDLSNLTVSALGGTVRGRAEISRDEPSLNFSLRTELRSLDLTAILQTFFTGQSALGRSPFTSRVSGTAEAHWRGRLEDFKSQFNLRFDPPSTSPRDFFPLRGNMRGSLGMEHGAYLRIQEGEFHTPASTLSGKGMLGSQQAALTITLATSNFEEWRPLARFFARPTERIPLVLRSEATFSGTIRGPVLRPEIRGRVSMGPFDYHDWSWDSLAASILATPDLLEITSGRVLGGDSTVTVAGYVTLEDWRVLRDGPARLALSLRRTPLEGLKAALGVENDFGGVATGQLQLEGSLLRLAGAGEMRVAPGIFAGEPFDSLSARLRVSESVWHIEDLELTKGPGHLSGKASVDPSRRFVSIQLQGAGFALAEFKHLESFRAGGSESQLEGSASFDLQGEGTPEDGRLHATWAIRDIRVSRSAIVDLQGRVDWQGQQMQLEGEARGPGGALSFAGVARTEGDWNLELRGQYTDLRLDPWIRLARKEEFSAQVVATGVLNVRGPLKKPEELEVHSQAQSLEVSFPDLTWKNENPVSLRYANGALVADRFRMRGPSTDLEVEGSARFKEPTSLSIVARGEADATLLSLIDPALQASGRSELRVRVSGSPAEPLLNGVMSIRDVNLGYREFPFRVTGLNGEIALEGERATVRSLQGTSGGGRVVLSGFVTFAGTPRYDARAELLSVRASYPTDFTSVLDGNLRVMGTPDRAQINGELIVRQLFTSENLTLLGRMSEVGRLASEAPPGIATPLASRTRLNIQVRSAPAVRLETRDLRLVADMDLRVQGTLANPVEVGTIHLLSGEAVFRGNRYRIIRGDISMTNPLRTQRFLDLEAQTRVQQYDLTVNLSGPFDRLKVAYRSDPPLSAADTLSLLAFGYARQQEVMSTSATQPLPTVGASALLSEALSSQVSGRIQQLFGVSRIRIDPNVGGFSTATGGARVTVEQQVTRDLTLTYVTTTASSEQRIIQFEWVLSDRVSLIGARDRNGILGMELKFRQRFK